MSQPVDVTSSSTVSGQPDVWETGASEPPKSPWSVIQLTVRLESRGFQARFQKQTFSEFRFCVQEHNCIDSGNSANSELPRRLIDLTEPADRPDHVKLVNASVDQIEFANKNHTTNGSPLKYAALSYCWGTGRSFTTTASNFQQYLSTGFKVSDLPRTLRHAVEVTRDVEIKYLWIDALCILQAESDSDAEAQRDWQQESSRMQFIYGNASLTIVAAGASHCDEGLYMWEKGCDTQPIYLRAWTLQEWLLSNRLLIFTTEGAYFLCNAKSDMRRWSFLPNHTLDQLGRQAQIRLSNITSKDSRANLATFWYNIAGNFSRRELTNPKDKLPAISGVAQKFGSLLGFRNEDYLAGIWRNTLLMGLLWTVGSVQWEPHPDLVNRVRRPGRAPSWSWASMDGEIHYVCGTEKGETKGETLAQAISCETVPVVQGDNFGELACGALRLKCSYYMEVSSFKRGSDIDYFLWDKNSRLRCSLFVDDVTEMERLGFSRQRGHIHAPQTLTYFLGLYLVDSSKEIHGIVVCFDSKVGAFVRIGAATSYKEDYEEENRWLKNRKAWTLKII